MSIKRGDIYYADLNPVIGSEQGGVRPVLIIQNNVGNACSSTLIVAAITSKMHKLEIPTHILIDDELDKESVVLLEQLRTVDRVRLKKYITTLSDETMKAIDKGLIISLGLEEEVEC